MNPLLAPEQRAKVEEFQRKHRIVLLTLLFTDMVGSTKLKQELGDREAVALIQRLRALVRGLLSRFIEGEEIETAGDSFFIVFAKPSDGVLFSLMLQSKLRDLGEEMGRPLLNRIGLHIGEVVIEERADSSKRKDLYGLQVDLCGRVMSLAEGDQILMTRSAFDNARQVLKGVDEPMEICEVGELNRAVLKAPSDSEKVHRFVSPDSEPVLGWRPAIGQGVPGTSWVLEEKLGEGGFGEVWLGRHKTTKERRVFKFCFRADRVRSLKREVTLFRVMKERLGEHPHIVGVEDVYLEEAPYYLTMEYVAGRDLKTWSEERLPAVASAQAGGGVGSIPLEVRLEIVAQVAEALQAAHDAGVIHRDVKPSNILVAADVSRRLTSSTAGASEESAALSRTQLRVQVKLTDFGIGQVVSDEVLTGMTRMGFTETLLPSGRATQAGTYMYMAPELFAGKPASRHSDIYSLGVLLFQMLVGDFSRLLTTEWGKEITEPLLREDLARCIAANPLERFETAGQLAKNLRSFSLRRVQELFESDNAAQGVARLAKLLRQEPMNRYAVERTFFALSQRNFVLPAIAPLQHEDGVRLAEFSPDGRTVLTFSGRSIRVWNTRTGESSIHPLRAEGQISFVQFSPDGLRLLNVFADNTTQIWNVDTGQPVGPRLQHDKEIISAQFSPDGRKVITTHRGNTARLWNAETGQPLTELLKHRPSDGIIVPDGVGMVHFAQFSPDGKQVLTNFIERYPHLWDAKTGQRLNLNLKTPYKLPLSASFARFSPDGQRLLTLVRDGIQVWDLQTGQPLTLPLKPKGTIQTGMGFETGMGFADWHLPRFSPDGHRILALSSDSATEVAAVQIWDAWTGELLVETIRPGTLGFVSAEFSSDGERFLTQSRNGTARVWDSHEGQPVTEPFGNGRAKLSSNGDRVLTVAGKAVQIWDLRTSAPLMGALHSYAPARCAELSADGRSLVTVYADKARIWDAQSGELLTEPLQHTNLITCAQFSLDGHRVVTASKDKTARIWDARTRQQLTEALPHDAEVLSAQFSPDGLNVVTTAEDKTVRVWDARTGLPLTAPFKHGSSFASAHMSPDSQWVLTTSSVDPQMVPHDPEGRPVPATPEDKVVRIWSLETGTERTKPLPHDDRISSVQFSPDGRNALTVSWDGSARLWDVGTGQIVREPLKYGAGIVAASFSPDGMRMLTASSDGIRVLETSSGKPVLEPINPGGAVSSAEFTPDGSRILTNSYNSVGLWNAHTGELLFTLRQPHHLTSARLSPDQRRMAIAYQVGGLFERNGPMRLWDVAAGLPVTEPLVEAECPADNVFFSPDGERVFASSGLGGVRVWEIPSARFPVPSWLPELAEAVAGLRVNAQGSIESFPAEQFQALKRQINAIVANDLYGRWAKWLFLDAETRTTSPSSSITVPQYTKRNLHRHDIQLFRAAVRLSPNNGLALARLARAILRESPELSRRQLGEVDWHTRRAINLAANEPDAWKARAEVLEKIGKLPEALQMMDQAIKLNPQDHSLWQGKGSLLEKEHRLEEAYAALTKAIELTANSSPIDQDAGSISSARVRQSGYLLHRSRILNCLNRGNEAIADRLAAYDIPVRDAGTESNLIDLTSHYNQGFDQLYSAFGEKERTKLSHGIHKFADVEFDLRGVVAFSMFASESEASDRICGIPANRRCKRLHFLHGALNLHRAEDGAEIGQFVIHFADGHQQSVPIVVGKDLGDEEKYPSLENRAFFLGHPATGQDGLAEEFLRPLFKTTWENPLPDMEVQTIDFVATLDGGSMVSSPCLVAITAE